MAEGQAILRDLGAMDPEVEGAPDDNPVANPVDNPVNDPVDNSDEEQGA